MKIGILKPDHFGDLILAAPAIAALQRTFDDLVLLCSPHTTQLAQFLFPQLPFETILFPHLDKKRRLSLHDRPLVPFRDRVDYLICLRWDSYMGVHMEHARIPYCSSGLDVLDLHVVAEQLQTVRSFCEAYDPHTSFSLSDCVRPTQRPANLGHIGLCISAGFPLNAWPLNHWLELAKSLLKRGVQITLIGGPCETTRLRVLAEALVKQTDSMPGLLIGDDRFGHFLQALSNSVDLVIATDSGTAHLASLACPVLSLFGGSPWQRFAPFGRANAIVTRGLPCSPCRQFDRTSLNTCHTQECLANLLPDQVLACLDAYLSGESFFKPCPVHGAWMAEAPWTLPNKYPSAALQKQFPLELVAEN